jgi:hypothetical protein
MNHRLASLLVFALFLLNAPTPASAQGGAYCLHLRGGGDSCGFSTFAQCMASASGAGGMCSANPRAGGPRAAPSAYGNDTPTRTRAKYEGEQQQRRQVDQRRQIEEERRQAEQQQRRQAEQRRQIEEQRRRAAATPADKGGPVTPANAPTVTAPVSAVVGNVIPLMDIDTNATPTLSLDGVRRVQAALKGRGFDPGPINGVLHQQMQVAMRTFQNTYGIEARGIIDNQTLFALGEAELASRSGESRPK